MGIFASFSFHHCPRCGASLPVMGMKFSDEPELHPVDCENCKAKLQVRRDTASGKFIIEERVEQ